MILHTDVVIKMKFRYIVADEEILILNVHNSGGYQTLAILKD